MSAMPAIPIDLEAIGHARGRLERALELVDVLETAGRELAELVGVDQADGAIIRALEPPPAAQDDVRQDLDDDEEPAAPPSPPRPDSSPAEPPSADDEPPAAPPAPPSSTPPAPAPAPQPAGDGNAARGNRTRADTQDRILAAFRRLGPDWQTTTQVAAEAGLGAGTVSGHLTELVFRDKLETNGKGGAHKRHRLPTVDVEPEQGDDDAAASGSAADPTPEPPADPLPPAAAAPAVSPRVRRELERERRQAELADKTDPRAGTLEGRITEALEGGGPCGIRELARRIGRAHPDEPLVNTLAIMVRHGDVRRYDNPRRAQVGQENPHFEVIG